ncbi:MAG: LrgB family protein [Lachnospiraceae bacterium]|nr:LrgB family protein [Lachnospiraceae bacterium]
MQEFLEGSLFFGAIISIVCYEAGMLLKKRFQSAILNPLLIGIISVIALLKLFRIDYQVYSMGASYISYFLTPATVCLAIPLYEQLELLKRNFAAIAAGIVSGVLASLFGVLALAEIFHMNHELFVSLLPKSITTAIGMGVSEELGGIVTITVSVIVITGVLGNIAGEFLLNFFCIEEPVARGLALGNSSHAIGTAKAMELGEVEGAVSSLAIVTAGLLTVILAPLFVQLRYMIA